MNEQELLKLLRDCVESLAGYRREMDEHQPCDAEKAARKYLDAISPMNECQGAAQQERPLNTNGGRETGHIGQPSECLAARGEAPRVPADAAPLPHRERT